ncbi:MAG: ABC transporter substrate-binding protein [Thermomicrobiales bacterium]
MARAAVAVGLASLNQWPASVVTAQSDAGTPVAASPDSANDELSLPAGITLAASPPSTQGKPTLGGALKLVRPGTTIDQFNPAAFRQDPQIPLSYLEPLVRPDPATLRPMPWLAERWAWRDDGLSLAFTLRDGVVWHDGAPLSAADAQFSFQLYQDDVESAIGSLFALVEAVEVASDRDLLVRFRERDANWLFNAATLPVVSVRQYGQYWDALPATARTISGFDWRESLPVGTGPWRVTAFDDRQVAFARFDDYWQRVTWLDTLEISLEEGRRNRLGAWESGTSQIAWPVRMANLESLNDPEGTLYDVPAASVMFAAFNFANPAQPSGSLWSDLRVRQAASLAIDRERYANEVFGGAIRWDAAGTVSQPWANDLSLMTPAHNPEVAAILLDEAGWIDYDGDGVREDFNGWQLRPVAILREDSRPELAAVLARVARDFANVGMALTIESLPAEAFADRWISRRDYDLIAYAYDQLPGFTDFDLYGSAWDIRTNPAGWNPGGYANADADAAINDFLAAVSIERQASALARLQRVVDEDLFGLWLGFPRDLVLVAAGIEGFAPDMAWQTARTGNLWSAHDS